MEQETAETLAEFGEALLHSFPFVNEKTPRMDTRLHDIDIAMNRVFDRCVASGCKELPQLAEKTIHTINTHCSIKLPGIIKDACLCRI